MNDPVKGLTAASCGFIRMTTAMHLLLVMLFSLHSGLVTACTDSVTSTLATGNHSTYRQSASQKPHPSSGATGTGIVVDERSHILTSYHVVKGCKTVMLRKGEFVLRARSGKYDEKLDLAIIVPERSISAIPAKFRKGPPAPGEPVVIAGFPGEVVNQGLLKAVSAKIVSLNATTLQPGMMRLSVGLNQGASGGPVLDRSGRVIGILSGLLVDSRSGKTVEAPGVAVSGEAVQAFLQRSGINFRLDEGSPATVSAIAGQAASQAVLIECSGH
ncbi:MAG: serine protease [Chromatiales bacterium]